MAIKTKGINHPALVGHPSAEGQGDSEVLPRSPSGLGMRLVLDQPNLDEPRMQHHFFDAGNENFLAPNRDWGPAYFVINQGTDLTLP